MYTIYRHEIRCNLKTLLIWFLCVGGLGFACILLFSGMQEEMAQMADGFSSMGAFSDAFGMSTLSIGTLVGYYATEIGTIHGLGGSMFAAILATTMLSKEEDAHTSEFLFSLPVSRFKIVLAKWLAVMTHIIAFNLLCVALYAAGFFLVGEQLPTHEFLLYHSMQIMLHTQLAALCFCVSAFLKKNKLGLGLGIVMLFYAYDLMARIIPDLSDVMFLSPFSYANAADILSSGEVPAKAAVFGFCVLAGSIIVAFSRFLKRDLAA